MTNAVLLNPSGIPNSGNLVALRAKYGGLADLSNISISAPDFGDAADGKDIFAAAAVMNGTTFNFSRDNANPELLNGAQVSSQYFDVFEVRPALGRAFTAEEDQPGAGLVAVLSNEAWKKRFAGDPGIIGRSIILDQRSYRVIGVMGPKFRWPNQAELWAPIALPPARYHDQDHRYNEYLFGVARLKPGATIQQANVYLNMKAEQNIASEGSGSYGRVSGWGMFSVPLTEFIGGNLRKPLTMLLAAVGMVLLIACANIAGLQIARASARQRDLAVRIALGASRWTLIRQALIESIVLTIVGLLLGFVVAVALAPLLLRGLPPNLAEYLQLSFTGPVLFFIVIVAAVCSLLCGVVPAWHRTQPGWFGALHESGRSGTSGRGGQRARSFLVVAQVALSLLLLAGAGLLFSSLKAVETVETGFQAYGVASASFSLPKSVYEKDETQAAFLTSLEDRLRAIPGVNQPRWLTPCRSVTTAVWRALPSRAVPRDRMIPVLMAVFERFRRDISRHCEFRFSRAATSPTAIVRPPSRSQSWMRFSPVSTFPARTPSVSTLDSDTRDRGSRSLESCLTPARTHWRPTPTRASTIYPLPNCRIVAPRCWFAAHGRPRT